MTYRISHHSTSDDSSAYRDVAEVQEWTDKDFPIVRFRKYLERQSWWSDAEDKALLAEFRKEVLRHFSAAEKVKKPPVDEMFADVYAREPKHLAEQRRALHAHLNEYGEHYPLNNFKQSS